MGTVFDIERYATKDGPGIRTVVFLKGCNLQCEWCQNPESQNMNVEILFDKNKCRGCGRCVSACPVNAIYFEENSGLSIDKEKCINCGKCIESCFYGARQITGKEYTVAELMDKISKDKPFFDKSGGGVTFSGGEPLLQGEFLREIISECKKQNIHVAIETAGKVPTETFMNIINDIDLIYFDIKHVDEKKHKTYTHSDNYLIKKNLEIISGLHKNIIVRIPVIPGFNSEEEDIMEIFNFLKNLKTLIGIELLPFHRLGESKYRFLDRIYKYEDVEPVGGETIEELKTYGMKLGLNIL